VAIAAAAAVANAAVVVGVAVAVAIAVCEVVAVAVRAAVAGVEGIAATSRTKQLSILVTRHGAKDLQAKHSWTPVSIPCARTLSPQNSLFPNEEDICLFQALVPTNSIVINRGASKVRSGNDNAHYLK